MPRSLWTGAISFGLVNVPVRMFTAVRKKDVRFHQLHATDGVRIQQKRVCPADGQEVPYEDLVKGYEISPDRYVIVTPEELEAFDPKATHTVDIEDFVSLDQIDPLFYDSSYYLLPDERGEKAYRLLLEAMTESRKVGIARVVIRTKQYLAAVRPLDGVLVLSTMNFVDEVVSRHELDGVPDDEVDVSDRELRMAGQLIDSLSTDFEPERYTDDYRQRVLDLIERKAEGEAVVAQPAPEAPGQVIDLMAALEASLAASKSARAGGEAARVAGGGTSDAARAAVGEAPGKASPTGDTAGGRQPARRRSSPADEPAEREPPAGQEEGGAKKARTTRRAETKSAGATEEQGGETTSTGKSRAAGTPDKAPGTAKKAPRSKKAS